MGVLSQANSTTTPLDAGESFIGDFEQVLSYSSVTIDCDTDQNTTLYVDHSQDKVNISRTVQLSSGTSSSIDEHTLELTSQYFRVRVVNGATPQGYLRLQTIYDTTFKSASKELSSPPDIYNQGTLTQSVILGKEPGNDEFVPIKCQNDGTIEISGTFVSGYSHSYTTAFNGPVTNPTLSTAFDLSNKKNIAVYGNSSADIPLKIKASPDGVTYFNTNISINTGNGDFYSSFKFPSRWIILEAQGSATLQCYISAK